MKGRVLVVDDEKNVGFVITAMLEKAGFETLCFQQSHPAMEAIEHEELDAVVTDLYMPGPGGMEILEFTRQVQPQLPVVMITAFGTIESAVSALKQGAFDFITKPFEQADLIAIVTKAVATHRERLKEPIPIFSGGTPTVVQAAVQTSFPMDSLLEGVSEGIREVRRTLERVAPTRSSLLILGEVGTGKEIIAHEIHRLSNRTSQPLIKVNCGAIPADLLVSEIFGSERGASAGGMTDRPGRLELAQGGTLFLDEVTELPPEGQARLLRFLQDGTHERVGATGTQSADVRILASTSRDLEAEARAGRFNLELYYQLSAFPLQLPALRDRQEDLDALVRAALGRASRKHQKPIARIEPVCLEVLERFGWPGNLRQLDNVMERMVLLSESDTLRVSDLPEEFGPLLAVLRAEQEPSAADEPLSFKERVRRETQNVERELIVKALDEEEGNVTRTAEKLGLSRKGLQLKMKELGVRRY